MPGKAPVILIVDDVRTNLLILNNILSKEGFNVLEASDGFACRQISEIQKLDIPVIFVSALGETANKIRGFSVGAVDYVTKPYDKEEIVARVKLHLRLSNAMKAVIETQANRLSQLTLAQQAILLNPEDLPEANFSVYYKSVMEAGGDFYDVISLSQDIYGYFCADVSGHNLGSSLATSSFKALISQNTGVVHSPKETLSTVNRVLEKVLPVEIYLTAVYILLNRKKKTVKIASAGHPSVIYLPLSGLPEILSPVGDILGMFENVSMDLLEMDVSAGDRFYTYTDGIIESDGTNDISREQGLERLVEQISLNREVPVDESIQKTITGLFGNYPALSDDILLMGFEV